MKQIGQYRVTHKLGEGGMGVVYAAHDERLDRPVAIKMLRRDTADEVGRQRLWREARSAASISHPNVCQVYEIGEHEGELFLAMELLQGEPLDARIAKGPMPIGDAVDITTAMLSALHALHARGLVHRDLKPSNLFLTPYGVKLLDFGLTRALEVGVNMGITQAGITVGTPHYMAPEAFTSETLDRRADVFAAGVMLYEMIAGTKPFTGKTMGQVVEAVLFREPPPLAGSPEVSAVDHVIRRALAKQPEGRHADAAAMAEALHAASGGESTRTRILPPKAPRPRLTRLIVLPFRMLRPDPEIDFLAYSLPDAITNSLSGLGSLVVRSMLVATRFSAEAPDLRQIAADADVDVVLTGSLLRIGSELRVTSQLMELPNGSVLWSEVAQVARDDLFQVQDDLARRIVDSLSLPLTAREHRLLGHDTPASSKSYEAYLRANQLSNDTQSWLRAKELYEQCLDSDPRYAPAWARLGRVHRMIGKYAGESAAHAAAAEDALKRALGINPDLALAHNLYAHLEIDRGQAKVAMVRLLDRAQSAGDPEIFTALVYACRISGLLEPSLKAHELARNLEPKVKTSVAQTCFQLRQYERVVEIGKEAPYIYGMAMVELGRSDEAALFLARVLEKVPAKLRPIIEAAHAAATGERDRTVATLKQFRQTGVKDPEVGYYVARHLASLGEGSDAIAALDAAVEAGFCGFPALAGDPWLDSVRSSAAFDRILQTAEERHRSAAEAFRDAGGEQILGPSTVS